jgi:hypothetical protein
MHWEALLWIHVAKFLGERWLLKWFTLTCDYADYADYALQNRWPGGYCSGYLFHRPPVSAGQRSAICAVTSVTARVYDLEDCLDNTSCHILPPFESSTARWPPLRLQTCMFAASTRFTPKTSKTRSHLKSMICSSRFTSSSQQFLAEQELGFPGPLRSLGDWKQWVETTRVSYLLYTFCSYTYVHRIF